MEPIMIQCCFFGNKISHATDKDKRKRNNRIYLINVTNWPDPNLETHDTNILR